MGCTACLLMNVQTRCGLDLPHQYPSATKDRRQSCKQIQKINENAFILLFSFLFFFFYSCCSACCLFLSDMKRRELKKSPHRTNARQILLPTRVRSPVRWRVKKHIKIMLKMFVGNSKCRYHHQNAHNFRFLSFYLKPRVRWHMVSAFLCLLATWHIATKRSSPWLAWTNSNTSCRLQNNTKIIQTSPNPLGSSKWRSATRPQPDHNLTAIRPRPQPDTTWQQRDHIPNTATPTQTIWRVPSSRLLRWQNHGPAGRCYLLFDPFFLLTNDTFPTQEDHIVIFGTQRPLLSSSKQYKNHSNLSKLSGIL